jgi:hypothetical protein
MKNFAINYILYICHSVLEEDETKYVKEWAVKFINIISFINKIYMCIFSLIFFPLFFLEIKAIDLINKN